MREKYCCNSWKRIAKKGVEKSELKNTGLTRSKFSKTFFFPLKKKMRKFGK